MYMSLSSLGKLYTQELPNLAQCCTGISIDADGVRFYFKFGVLFLFVDRISPSAKRAMPVLSKLSPELDKENEKGQEHSVTTVVREAAMLVMATPLLIDGLLPKKLDRTGSWVSVRIFKIKRRVLLLEKLSSASNSGRITYGYLIKVTQ